MTATWWIQLTDERGSLWRFTMLKCMQNNRTNFLLRTWPAFCTQIPKPLRTPKVRSYNQDAIKIPHTSSTIKIPLVYELGIPITTSSAEDGQTLYERIWVEKQQNVRKWAVQCLSWMNKIMFVQKQLLELHDFRSIGAVKAGLYIYEYRTIIFMNITRKLETNY